MSDYSDDEARNSYCKFCEVVNDRGHKYSNQHTENLLLWALAKYRKAVAEDKNGITITASTAYILPSTGQELPIQPQTKKGQFISIMSVDDLPSRNDGITYQFKMVTKKKIYLMKCELLRDVEYFHLRYDGEHQPDKVSKCRANTELIFTVTLNTDFASKYRTLIYYEFQTFDNKERFHIVKELVVNVKTDLEGISIENEENHYTRMTWDENTIVDSISRPFLSSAYSIPAEFTQLFDVSKAYFKRYHRENEKPLLARIKKCIDGELTRTNYKEFFKYLLWLEELGARIKIKRFNMEKTPVKVRGEKVILEVVGLAEKRPSLVVGDFVLMHIPDTSITFRGIIQNVCDKEIEIKDFNPQFLAQLQNPDVLVNVEFEVGRLTYVRMHKAVDIVDENMLTLLFPERKIPLTPLSQTYVSANSIYNPHIRTNPQQIIAIENILKRCFNNDINRVPYIVFGPPGTGKTVTIIEAVRQIFRYNENAKVLICAPTNAACDNITEKLADNFTAQEMLRYIAFDRPYETMPERVKNFTNKERINQNGIRNYRIVVSTVMKIGSFTSRFTATNVFIDEAGQALEPEALVAISGILSHNGQLVLSGDPKQLEPLCSSSLAERKGLGKSLISRLLSMPTYKFNCPDSHLFVTKLLLNYRNHEDILKLPNELFYEGELVPMSQYPVNDFINKVFIPVTKVDRNFANRAIEFCGVVGEDERRGKSPSYYNRAEIDCVVKYIECLIGPGLEIPPKDIGVITPYKRQCILLQQQIKNKLNIQTIEVGSTEAFQGKEKRIIIISTVRARADLLLYDRKYNIGFVNNDKRFNVAITRAISKLIVVGNPVCLYTSEYWGEFMDLCKEFKSYRGYKIDRKTAEERNKIFRNLLNISLLRSN